MPAATLPEIAAQDAIVREVLESDRTHVQALRVLADLGVETSDSAVRRYRSSIGWERPEPEGEETLGAQGSVRAEETADGLTLYHDSWPVELGEDFGPLIEFFGLNPENFEVIEDQVKVSKWMTSKGADDGSRDVIWLYSYKVAFRKIKEPINKVDYDYLLARINDPNKSVTPAIWLDEYGNSAPEVYVHQQGDEQIGKGEGGGLEGVVQRTEEVVARSVHRLEQLIARGHKPQGILDVSNGDTIENIFGHYPSQQRTTATLRKQFQVARDLDIMRTEAFAQFGLPLTKVYCTDNHGEMRQTIGMAPFTSESDNLTLIMAESVKDVLDRSSIAGQIEWCIPHDEWWTLVQWLGLNFAVGHGHKASGNLVQWVKNQRDNLNFHKGFRADAMLLGHKHHLEIHDVAGTMMIQTGSLDGGSPFWEAISGDRTGYGALSYMASAANKSVLSELIVL